MVTAILFILFALFLIMSVPIAASIGLATILTIWITDLLPVQSMMSDQMAIRRMFNAIEGSFPLMAIPFFMVAGAIMERGGMSKRLVHLASALVGHRFGGFALITVLASLFFASMSGSSPATAAAIGAIMIPAMIKNGYKPDFAAATQASSSFIGVILPPSILMVTFGVMTGTSIGDLFIAGIIPGLLIAAGTMIVAIILSKKYGYRGHGEPALFREVVIAFWKAIPAMIMPVIILWGIFGGWFTPTEAANVAVVYGLLVGFFIYRELTLRDLPKVLRAASINTAMVMFIIAVASAFSVLLTMEQIPTQLAQLLLGITDNPIALLMILNVMLLILGAFLEANAAIIILAPILLPAVIELGINPIHFGIIMVVNLAIGMVTPPVGLNLFVTSSISKTPIEKIINANWWYLLASIIVLIIITYIPSISLFLLR